MGGLSKWVLWGRMVLGVMPPVHVQGPLCPDSVSSILAVDDYPNTPGTV